MQFDKVRDRLVLEHSIPQPQPVKLKMGDREPRTSDCLPFAHVVDNNMCQFNT